MRTIHRINRITKRTVLNKGDTIISKIWEVLILGDASDVHDKSEFVPLTIGYNIIGMPDAKSGIKDTANQRFMYQFTNRDTRQIVYMEATIYELFRRLRDDDLDFYYKSDNF